MLEEQEPPKETSKGVLSELLHTSPLLVAVVGGITSVLIALIGNILQTQTQLSIERQKAEAAIQLERQEFEFSLIREALASETRQDAADELIFLVDIGIIKSLDTLQIRARAEDPESLPQSSGAAIELYQRALDLLEEPTQEESE